MFITLVGHPWGGGKAVDDKGCRAAEAATPSGVPVGQFEAIPASGGKRKSLTPRLMALTIQKHCLGGNWKKAHLSGHSR